MPRIAVCPDELEHCVFRGVDAVRQGLVTRERLRHRMWSRLAEDVYVLAEHRDEPWARLEALRLITDERNVAFGLTAAWVHGVWQPRPGRSVPLNVSRPAATSGRPVSGSGRRRLTLGTDGLSSTTFPDVAVVGGVTTTTTLRTCFDLMRDRRLVEAVVVADAFLFAGAVDPLSLAVFCQERHRWPGVRQARLAAGLASPYSRSAGESRLRLLLVLAGFEVPLVNVPVVDGGGHHVATPDLQVRGRRWAWIEYDGAYHETAGQHEADVRRENRLTVASGGVPVLRYDRRHLGTPSGRSAAVDEVADAVGVRPRSDMRTQDFVRPPGERAW